MERLPRKAGGLLYWMTLFAVTINVSVQCGAQQSQGILKRKLRQDHLDRIVAEIVRPFLNDSCHVGLSIAVVRERTAQFYNFGSTSRTARNKPGPDSLYEIASVTKTFTGVLAAKAILDGRMQLDADFRPYLPGNYPNLDWHGRPITLKSLATHTSGLPRDLPDTDDLYAHRNPETLPYQLIARESGYDRARYLDELHEVALRGQPGKEENYSNLGFKVIGWGLEHVYGMLFEQLMEDIILGPLRMDSSSFVLTPDEKARLVNGYSPAGNLMPYHLRNAGAAYGLYSTPRDMAKYVEWELDEASPVIRLAHTTIEGNDQDGKALVWNTALLDGSRELWHGGGTFGMSSQVVLFPDSHEGYALLANDTCRETENVLKELAVALHRQIRTETN